MEIGDNTKSTVKGVGTVSLQLESENPLKMSDVLYVPGLKKNLLSIFVMEDRGYVVAFVDGQVLAWPKGLSLDLADVIGTSNASLFKLTS